MDPSPIIRRFVKGGAFTSGGPLLILDEFDGSAVRRIQLPIVGQTIALQRLRSRRCTGFYDLRTFAEFTCPSFRKLPEGGGTQCAECFRRSGFNPAFYNVLRSELSEQQQAYNLEPHAVYLASFGQGLVKVGISNARRLRTRILEQGALAAAIVATVPDAYEARTIERRVSEHLGLTEALTGRAKRLALRALTDPAEPMTSLEAALPGLERLRLPGATREIVGGIASAYGARSDDLGFLAEPIIDLSDTRPLAIGGVGRALVGSTLLVEHGRLGLTAVSLQRLVGHGVAQAAPEPAVPDDQRQQALL
ncbi:MAG TPA: DUF2797 domain-containing protein [Allosphingosinicella sp.]